MGANACTNPITALFSTIHEENQKTHPA
jgi:hypothetical protein